MEAEKNYYHIKSMIMSDLLYALYVISQLGGNAG